MELVRDKRVKDAFMVETLKKMFDRGELRKDHPLQRKPGSWTADYRDGFIVSVIKQEDVDSVKICEQLFENGVTLWVIDGGHRLTALTDYKNNAFKIGNKIDMPLVKYQTSEQNESGKRIHKTVEYDLRGKRYSDLPEELKEKFDNDKIDVVKHLDCTDDEIAYHIRRYNKQKSMNVSQTSVTYMEKTAQYLKDISTNNRFFKDCGAYTQKERTNGTVDRIVMESVMCMFHLNNWKKSGRFIAEFLDKNSSKEEFDRLNENLNALTGVVTEDVDNLFNKRDSFVWFALFKRCLDYGETKKNFAEFLGWFSKNTVTKEKFEKISNGGTKDRKVITDKLKFLETAMVSYLHIDIKKTQKKDVNILDFIHENVARGITQEDVDLYAEDFELYTLDVDNRSKLMDEKNKPSMLALIAYAYKEDKQLDEWIVDYFKRNIFYDIDQKQNFVKMRSDFEKYVSQKDKVSA